MARELPGHEDPAERGSRGKQFLPSRRSLLKAGGVALALPWLEGLAPRLARGAVADPPKRMVCICAPLSVHPPFFFPEKAGRDYEASPYLEPFQDMRDDFTVISGLAHPGVDSGHDSIFSYLTTAQHPERRAGFRNTISVDQLAAEHIGDRTRHRSLNLSAEGFSLSWTRTGALVPSEFSPAAVFARLFLEGKPDVVQGQIRRLRDGQSILDQVGQQAQQLQGDLSANDKEKLDEYFGSVRELEKRLQSAEEWAKKPKPKVDVEQPKDATNPADLVGRTKLMFDLAHLAIQTDSTRLITMMLLGTSLVPPIQGVNDGHHNLSHHGQDPEKIKQLKTVEMEKMRLLHELLLKLKNTREDDSNLLARTAVMFGSNLGNASNHSCRNLPILFAGGGFRHGQHLAFDQKAPTPLANLFVSMLQHLGLEIGKFGTSTGTLTGLEVKA